MLPKSENLITEFKTSFNEDVIETLVAFANAKGGAVYVGVTDKGVVKGLIVGKETVQNWINEVKNKTDPQLIPDVEVMEVDALTVVKFYIPEYPIKPVSIRGKYYKRIANANHIMNAAEIADLYAFTMQNSWDSYLYKSKTIADLNFDKIRLFIDKVNAVMRFTLPIDPIEALLKLKLVEGNIPTNAAMILFSKENLLFNVHVGRFKTPSYIIADKMINGNLFEVLDETMQTIIGHLKFAFEITGKTTQRTEIPEYPLDAVRELVVNALVHRDYQSPTDIQIRIYDNSITFFNPSGLFGNITESDLSTDYYQASTRNKLLAEALYLTSDIEKYGSGFIRIRKAIADYPTMKFEYQNLGHGFLTQFIYTVQKVSTNTETTVETTVETIIQLIKDNPQITQTDLMRQLNLSRRGVEWHIKKLKESDKIVRHGTSRGKGGYWLVIER